MIVGCVGVYGERIEQATVCIKRLRSHVDRYVVIVDESVTEEQKQELRDLGCEIYFHPWEDSMVKMRNQYLEKCQTDDWIIVHDPDEWFCQKFCEDSRKICETAEKKDLILLLINSHDITYQEDGTKAESISDFFKNLIFQKKEGTHYEGVGEVKEVHEALIIPGLTGAVRLPKEDYWYEHVKYWHEVWERAARNIFLGGGGNNVGERNPSWRPLRDICEDLGLGNWPETRDYLRKGDVDPRLKEWLWENRFEGFDYDHEEMEFGRWYFEYLHPEEAAFPAGRVWKPVTEILEGSPAEVYRYVQECYETILGRHEMKSPQKFFPEDQGKNVYAEAILEGRIKREDLPELLKRSPEYLRARLGMETIRLQVPVNVDIGLSEELFIQALIKSNLYWEDFKPKLDVGTFLEGILGEEGWKNFQYWFYGKEPTLKQFLKKLREIAQLKVKTQ